MVMLTGKAWHVLYLPAGQTTIAIEEHKSLAKDFGGSSRHGTEVYQRRKQLKQRQRQRMWEQHAQRKRPEVGRDKIAQNKEQKKKRRKKKKI